MKVNYIDNKNTTTLNEIEEGQVFRPMNSKDIYIKTIQDGMSDLFSDSETHLERFYQDYQNGCGYNSTSDGCEDLIACVDLVTGELFFLYRYLRVEGLKAVLNVEGD